MPVVLRDSLALEGAEATVGDEACVSTGFGSATPAALPWRTRDASDVGKAAMREGRLLPKQVRQEPWQ